MKDLDISRLLRDLLAGQPMAPTALEAALVPILRGEADDVQVAGLLVTLATRPPRADLLAAAARVTRHKRQPLRCRRRVRPINSNQRNHRLLCWTL